MQKVEGFQLEADADGTTYRLAVVSVQGGGLGVVWYDGRAALWAASWRGGDVRVMAGKVGKVDLRNIARIVDGVRS